MIFVASVRGRLKRRSGVIIPPDFGRLLPIDSLCQHFNTPASAL
jgi:hypothetical protein